MGWIIGWTAFVFIVAGVTAHNDVKRNFQKEAVERGFAHYREDDGKWEWKEK